MKTRVVKCYHGFAHAGNQENHDVWYTLPDHGYDIQLFTCVGCGELFCIDAEYLELLNCTLAELVPDATCPSCKAALSGSLQASPRTFRTNNGVLGHFEPSRIYPVDADAVTMNVWDLASLNDRASGSTA